MGKIFDRIIATPLTPPVANPFGALKKYIPTAIKRIPRFKNDQYLILSVILSDFIITPVFFDI
jgi:hypothetical protein